MNQIFKSKRQNIQKPSKKKKDKERNKVTDTTVLITLNKTTVNKQNKKQKKLSFFKKNFLLYMTFLEIDLLKISEYNEYYKT